MKRFLLFLLVVPALAALFLAWPQCTGPVFASTYAIPYPCPDRIYVGCRRGVGWETWSGDAIGGGGFDNTKPLTRDVAYNSFIARDNAIVDGDIYGGAAWGATDVRENQACLWSGSQAKNVYGGATQEGNATDNEVQISRSATLGDAVGGWSQASGNPVVSGNIVRLSNSSKVGATLSAATRTPRPCPPQPRQTA